MASKPCKVLLLTGDLAKDAVESCTSESGVETEVVALKIAVAALLTPKAIVKGLENIKIKGFDMILVPGLS